MLRCLRRLALFGALAALGSIWGTPMAAQVTTGTMRGSVTDSTGRPLEGVRVRATHTPSATIYQTLTRADGRFTLPGMRVGGPYTVEATRIGFARQSRDDLTITLGVSTDVEFRMGSVAAVLSAVTVTSVGGQFSTTRTGASTTVPKDELEKLPTISRRIDDFTRLTPQANGSSFAGMDNRLNNITVDGSYFNNSFGLAGQPGDRTGVAPISLDAIEAVQVNIAPFDVRQGNFVGAAVNTVTKSGTNEFSGSLYYNKRDQSLVGTRLGGTTFNPGTFDFKQFGARLGGPIIPNRLFFFASYETDKLKEPGTTFLANTGGQPVGGQITRVRASSLDSLSNYLLSNFNYVTGPYQGYGGETPSDRLTAKLDFSLNSRNKFILRYTELTSNTDVLLSNSSSLGFGTRRTNLNGLNFQNSNYQIMENIKSLVGEWNAIIGDNMSNNLIIGYTKNDESRASRGSFFPMVDILESSSVYTTFGFEPFTPNNELRYKSSQVQDNFTIYGRNHDLTIGVSYEKYNSENVFFPGSQSVYVYNSLNDFYTDANDYLANSTRTVSPVNLRRFQVRWSNIPGQVKPIQPLEVQYAGAYLQDEWRASPDLTLTLGVRIDAPKFGDTGFTNAQSDGYTYRDESGNAVQYNSAKLPDSKPLFSPRLGINWDVNGDGVTQVRGGTGVFTGRPAYVWISNQIGNNGVLTGFEQFDNTTARPFHPDPNHYKPATVTGAPASSYEMNFTDPNFKFPQLWRTNLAIDRQLPWNLTGTIEWLLGQDVNGVYYIDANLPAADASFAGPDNRPRWTVDNCPTVTGVQHRLNCNVTGAIVLKNQDVGNSWSLAASLERSFSSGLYAKAAYSYGESRNTVDAGSIAFGSWNNNQHVFGPNSPGVGYSGNTLGHRYFIVASYTNNFLPFGPTSVSAFLNSQTSGNGSFVFGGDMNGDGGTSNDLIYIPKNDAEMNFQQYTSSGVTFTVPQQVAAFNAFIKQDRYLRNHRGGYVERGAIQLPMVTRIDLSLSQDIVRSLGDKPHKLQVRMDILNFTNMLNSDWGRSYSFVTTSPLVPAGVDGTGKPLYRLRNIGTSLLSRTSQRNSSVGDVFRIQLGVRYTFN